MFDLYYLPFGVILYLFLLTSFCNLLEEELLEIGNGGDDEEIVKSDLLQRLQFDFLFLYLFLFF